eukprot:GILK01011222.1.p1 GENE.GILK01011222.1~~GILK01011222.1.p1  ORF type:complete len:509 (-),score=108.66 GILK01011222.1:149-1675(-)
MADPATWKAIVFDCMKYLETSPVIKNEDMFRGASTSPEVLELRTLAERAGHLIIPPKLRDVASVASLLKIFLLELSEPLLTNELYQQFLDAQHKPVLFHRLCSLQAVLAQLPEWNSSVLHRLLAFLTHVLANASSNRMTPARLAATFGAALLVPDADSETFMADAQEAEKALTTLIQYASFFFADILAIEHPPQKPIEIVLTSLTQKALSFRPPVIMDLMKKAPMPSSERRRRFQEHHALSLSVEADSAVSLTVQDTSIDEEEFHLHGRRNSTKKRLSVPRTPTSLRPPPTPSPRGHKVIDLSFEADIKVQLQENEIKRYKSRVDALTAQMAEILEGAKSTEEELDLKQYEVTKLKSEMIRFHELMEEKEKRYLSGQDELAKARVEVAAIREKLNSVTVKFDTVSKNFQTLRLETDQLRSQLELESSYKKDAMRKSKEQQRSLSNEVTRWRQEVDMLTAKLYQFQSDNGALKEESMFMREELEHLRQENETLRIQNTTLQELNKSLRR